MYLPRIFAEEKQIGAFGLFASTNIGWALVYTVGRAFLPDNMSRKSL